MLRNLLFSKYSRVQITRLLNNNSSTNQRDSTQDGIVSLNTYHEQSEETLEYISDKFDSILEDEFDKGADVSLNSGVLTLTIDSNHTYVINKQTPNRQIWLSSPVSGPMRFDFVDGKWIDKHSKKELKSTLAQEVSILLKRKIDC